MNCVLNGISNQEQEPVHDQGNSSPLVNEKAHDDSSDIRKKKAPKKKDKTAEQRKKDQEKQKRFRLRTMYESQIKDIEGEVGSFSKEVLIMVLKWENGVRSGNFQKMTQMTHIDMVRNKAPLHANKNGNIKAYKPHTFRGAIVAFGDPKDRNYQAIPESHFQVKVPCYAKHASHGKAKPITAHRLTGICDTVHVEGRESVGWVYVQWENNETDWLPSHQVVGVFVTDNGRERRGPSSAKGNDDIANDVIANSDRPQNKGDKQKVDTYYSPFASYIKAHAEEQKKKEKGAKSGNTNGVALGKGKEDMNDASGVVLSVVHPSFSVPTKHIATMGKTQEEELHEWLRSEIPNITELVHRGNEYWAVSEVGRYFSQSKPPRPPPDSETIHTSFLYDVLRGNIRGCIAHMDSAFQFSDEEHQAHEWGAPSAYIHLICDPARQAQAVRRQKKRKRTIRFCKVDKCKSCVHGIFWKEGVCYSHGNAEKKLCKKCKRSTSSRYGGLCRTCFQGGVNKKGKGLCVMCGTREPKRTGGRYNICI